MTADRYLPIKASFLSHLESVCARRYNKTSPLVLFLRHFIYPMIWRCILFLLLPSSSSLDFGSSQYKSSVGIAFGVAALAARSMKNKLIIHAIRYIPFQYIYAILIASNMLLPWFLLYVRTSTVQMFVDPHVTTPIQQFYFNVMLSRSFSSNTSQMKTLGKSRIL